MTATERYARADAKAWAAQSFSGICNVIIPSYSSDLRRLNEAGIRHDVRRNIELGFWGALLVSEAGTTLAEMRQFAEIAIDEARGRQYFVLHGAFNGLEETVEAARDARSVGVDALLMAYPNSFYPSSIKELTDYTRAICEGSDLAVILFCAPHFNLARLDPAGFPLETWLELISLDTVVALKYEVGHPGVVGSFEMFRACSGRGVLACDPYEPNLPLWAELFDVPWVGTSNYEYYGDAVPRMHELLRQGGREQALALYWKLQPARETREALRAQAAGANFNHRYLWKFQAWLQGYNGGPLRQPAMKLTDSQMQRAAAGLVAAGLLEQIPKDFGEFFTGRHPT